MSPARWTVAVAMVAMIGGALVWYRPYRPDAVVRDGPQGSAAAPAMPESKPTAGIAAKQSAVPSAARTAGVQPAHASADRLRTEAGLLIGADLQTDRVSAVLRGDGFDALLDAMDDDLRSDTDASALTDAYADAIADQFDDGGLALDRIACGLRVCAVRIVGPDDPEPWAAWSARFDADTATPSYARIEHEGEFEPGLRERRLVFTVDPSSAGLTISAY